MCIFYIGRIKVIYIAIVGSVKIALANYSRNNLGMIGVLYTVNMGCLNNTSRGRVCQEALSGPHFEPL